MIYALPKYTYTRAEFVQNLLNRDKSGWSCGCPSGHHVDMGYCSCGVEPAGCKARLMALLPWKFVCWKLKYVGSYNGVGLHERIG